MHNDTPQSTERQYPFRREGVGPALTLGMTLIAALGLAGARCAWCGRGM